MGINEARRDDVAGGVEPVGGRGGAEIANRRDRAPATPTSAR